MASKPPKDTKDKPKGGKPDPKGGKPAPPKGGTAEGRQGRQGNVQRQLLNPVASATHKHTYP